MADPIDLGTAVALGALQGLTEFLPVSSSGHVAIGAMLFGETEMPLSLVVLLHAGTLLATLMVVGDDAFRLGRDIVGGLGNPRAFLKTTSGRLTMALVAATLPTVVIALSMKEHVEGWSRSPWIIGVCLLGSALTVLTTRFTGGEGSELSPRQAALVGIAQGLAVLPGLSRSGSTIAMAMLLGMSGPAAFRFSFLLSLPAVLGAVLLELSPDAMAELGPNAWVGGAVALVIGYIALRALRHLVIQGRFWAFTIYLVPVGTGLIIWSLWSPGS